MGCFCSFASKAAFDSLSVVYADKFSVFHFVGFFLTIFSLEGNLLVVFKEERRDASFGLLHSFLLRKRNLFNKLIRLFC